MERTLALLKDLGVTSESLAALRSLVTTGEAVTRLLDALAMVNHRLACAESAIAALLENHAPKLYATERQEYPRFTVNACTLSLKQTLEGALEAGVKIRFAAQPAKEPQT